MGAAQWLPAKLLLGLYLCSVITTGPASVAPTEHNAQHPVSTWWTLANVFTVSELGYK